MIPGICVLSRAALLDFVHSGQQAIMRRAAFGFDLGRIAAMDPFEYGIVLGRS
jgi:hypothetical protein